MPETTNQPDIGRYRDYGRLQPYAFVGFVLVIGFLAAAVLAYRNVPGPGLFTTEVAVWTLGLCVALLTLGLLCVLFTLRGALRTVRAQATEVAVLRSRVHTHQIIPAPAPPRPAPPIEYQSAPTPAAPVAPTAASRRVESIEGIGPVTARRLERGGIETLRDLRAARPDELAKSAGVNTRVALRWKVMAGLLTLSALDPQDAEVLLHCGVGSVEDLARRDPYELHRRAYRANHRTGARLAAREIPRSMVEQWVMAARAHLGDQGSLLRRVESKRAAQPAGAIPSS
ncbi:MAG: DUF4332 domain-containing protein [Euryarchaeota archaeon]|nr:DUF4332 domain-containing protein [Euryarchaeota archaeon]